MSSNILGILHTELTITKGEEIYTDNYKPLLDSLIKEFTEYLKHHDSISVRLTTIIEE